jgi:predicted bacteriocin transport accessory protein
MRSDFLKKIPFFIILTILLVSCVQKTDYELAVENFKLITPNEILEKNKDGDDFFLYIGKSTCPYCKIFAPKLKIASENNNLDIFYLDVSDENQESLRTVLKNYKITYVPFLIYFENDNSRSYFEIIEDEEIEIKDIEKYLNNPHGSSKID